MSLEDTKTEEVERASEWSTRNNRRLDYSYVHDLISVLSQNPSGLRRWSVMQALRKSRQKAGHTISQKFEDEIEHMFRRFCASSENAKTTSIDDILFYRPTDRA